MRDSNRIVSLVLNQRWQQRKSLWIWK